MQSLSDIAMVYWL